MIRIFVTQAEINAGTYPELGPQGEGISKQYAHREPRFYASVAYNGSVWEMTSAQDQSQRYQKIWYYRDYPNGQQVSASDSHNMRTGIGIKSTIIHRILILKMQKVRIPIR
ncbi:RagB/SusD family nutrient uptake outer membrane protein [Bacteroides sp. CR5/BHMF/2]|nr:RagB/SusD family nutrient uptake outer membrane protein [Bacteroides sp. CR5/BHMF/2]